MSRTNKLRIAEDNIGHTFKKPDLLWEALQAAGSPNMFVGGKYLREGNKSLAGIGNAVMSLILKTQGRDEDMSIGACTTRLNDLVNNTRLATVCDDIELTQCIVLNPSARGEVPGRLKATTVEAVVAAVFLDSDLETCESMMAAWGLTLNKSDALVLFDPLEDARKAERQKRYLEYLI